MAFFTPTEAKLLIQSVRPDGKLDPDVIEVDVSEAEDYNFPGDVSELPIEDGSSISDHITNLPLNMSLDLRFSDTPVSKFNPLKSLEAEEGRGRKTALKLIGWKRDKRQFIITSGLASFNSIALKSISIPRTAADGRSVLCRAVFAEIPINARSGDGIQGTTKTVITAVEHTAFGLVRLGDIS